MSYCFMRVCCGNVFTEPLPNNGYTRHIIVDTIYVYRYGNDNQDVHVREEIIPCVLTESIKTLSYIFISNYNQLQ
jgi:hypothetical protein